MGAGLLTDSRVLSTNPQPDAIKVSRKATQIKRDADASALRKAVQRSDPQALGGKHELPQTDSSERRLFIFYQDEGGMRATGDHNEELGVIYYLVSSAEIRSRNPQRGEADAK